LNDTRLEEFFREHSRLALAFSGGTDSAYLLYAAKKYGADVKPYFVLSQFQPEKELNDALRLSSELRVPMSIITLDALAVPCVRENPADRCYYCKRVMLSAMKEKALSEGYTELIDGLNASDDCGDRPGVRAARELGVLSPLRECGITKADIHVFSREAGLFTAGKPSYACLATRVPCGEEITQEKLRTVEEAEKRLDAMGFSDFRARLRGKGALLQFHASQLERANAELAGIKERLDPLFSEIKIDPKGR